MNLKFLKTKEFKIKLIISIILLVLFSLSFLFENQLKLALGLTYDYSENEVSESVLNESFYKVHYLDVGQGNCAVIELPDGKIMVVDGGSDMYGDKILSFLKTRNINTIDFMIATHADADHIGGLNYLFDEFEIINIFRPMQIAGMMVEESIDGELKSHFEVYEKEDLKTAYKNYGSTKFIEVTSQRYRTFIENIYSETYTENNNTFNANVTVFYDGLEIAGEGYKFEFYAPLKTDDSINFSDCSNTKGFMTKIYSQDSSNASSAIFLLNVCGRKFFFSGDASALAQDSDDESKFSENEFLNSLSEIEKIDFISVDVLLVAHHGSKNSTSEELLDLLKPHFAIISVGKNNYGHPSDEVLNRLNETESIKDDGIIKTIDSGDISFGNVNEDLCFAVQNATRKNNLKISFKILMLIFFFALLYFVVNIKFGIMSNKF